MTHTKHNMLAITGLLAMAGAAIGQTCTGPYTYDVTHRMEVRPIFRGQWFAIHTGYAVASAGSTKRRCRAFDSSGGVNIIRFAGVPSAFTAEANPSNNPSHACAETSLSVSQVTDGFRADHGIRGATYAKPARCRSIFRRNAWAWSSSGGAFIARGPAGTAVVADGIFGFQGEFKNTHIWPFTVRAKVVVDPIVAQVLDANENVIDSYDVGEIRSVVYGAGETEITYEFGDNPRVINEARDMDLDIVIHPFIAQPGEDGELRLSVRDGVFTRSVQNGIFAGIAINGTAPSFWMDLPEFKINYTIPLPADAVDLQFGSSAGAHSDTTTGELGDGCSLITGPGEGADYAPISAIAPSASLYGVPATVDEHALDFFTSSADAELNQIIVPFYQEGAALTGPSLSRVSLRIWEGVPGAGGTIVGGDTTTPLTFEVMDGHALYRVGSGPGDKLDTTRPIKFVSIDTDGISVTQGQVYGVEVVMVEAPGLAEPFIPVSPYFNDTVDRAMRFDSASGQWSAIRDPGSNAGACLGMRVLDAVADVLPGAFVPEVCEDYESTPGARTTIDTLFGGIVPVIPGSVSHNSVEFGGWQDFRSPGGPIQPTSGNKFGVGFGFGDFTLDFTGIGGIFGFSGMASAAGGGGDTIEFFDMSGLPMTGTLTDPDGFGPGDGTMEAFSFVSTDRIGSVRLTGSETAYDDLCITSQGPAACRADIDGDGVLDIFDFLAFQNLFAAGDLAADFDGDGVLDIFDFLAFQNEFDAGCP